MARDPRERFMSHVALGDGGCWLWSGSMRGGFRLGTLQTEPTMDATRAAWTLFVGPIPAGRRLVRTGCASERCVNPTHRGALTSAQVGAWMRATGRYATRRGESAPGAKLTDAAVLAIRAWRPGEGSTLADLAVHHRVSVAAVGHVRSGWTWRHLLPGGA